MDNAGRRNIHARATRREACLDRQTPSPDEDDRIGLSKTVRRSRPRTPQLVRPRLARMAVQRPELPCDASTPRRCETGLYGASGSRASPSWGRTGKKLSGCSRTARRPMSSVPPNGLCRLQHPTPRLTVPPNGERGRHGRTHLRTPPCPDPGSNFCESHRLPVSCWHSARFACRSGRARRRCCCCGAKHSGGSRCGNRRGGVSGFGAISRAGRISLH